MSAPLSPQTRAALVAEFRAAREKNDFKAGREIYRAARDHDAAHPDEPSLVAELRATHTTVWVVVA